jgi:GntR family transcriptional regulator, gluconate operon transcriptional repressor
MTDSTTANRRQFKRMQAPSLVDLVAADLREAILAGRLASGARISDVRVAEEMGISRAPVREALRQLAARGLVEEEPRRGAFVTRLTPARVSEIYDCRRALEGLAARRLAAGDAREDAVSTLRSLVAEMEAAAKAGDPLAMADVDHRFHVTLCELTANGWLVRLYEQLADQSRMLQALDSVAHAQSDRRDLVMRHEPIVDAIASADPDTAEDAIVAHIDLAERLFLQEVPGMAEDA